MGVLITWAKPSSQATWTKFCIEKSQDGSNYAEIARINAKDSNGNWVTEYYDIHGNTEYYRVRGYDETRNIYSEYSETLKSEELTTTYASVNDVLRFLQLETFGFDFKPNVIDIVRIIQRKEDEIDFLTGNSWRERKSGTTTIKSKIQYWEYYSIPTRRKIGSGYMIKLRHRFIKPLDKTKGDALEVWNGNSYENWIDYSSDRAKVWWIDELNGILYITGGINPLISEVIRIKYRYGEDEVPGDIKEACILLSAIDILTSEDRSVLLPEGTTNVPYTEKINIWRKRASEILSRRVEWRVGL